MVISLPDCPLVIAVDIVRYRQERSKGHVVVSSQGAERYAMALLQLGMFVISLVSHIKMLTFCVDVDALVTSVAKAASLVN